MNKYKMLFASFVGVIYHHQLILLECALLEHEHIATYKWLFSISIGAMGGSQPSCIITYQCESIKACRKVEMPDTIHCYCIWPIYSKIPTKIRGVTDYDEAKREFLATVKRKFDDR